MLKLPNFPASGRSILSYYPYYPPCFRFGKNKGGGNNSRIWVDRVEHLDRRSSSQHRVFQRIPGDLNQVFWLRWNSNRLPIRAGPAHWDQFPRNWDTPRFRGSWNRLQILRCVLQSLRDVRLCKTNFILNHFRRQRIPTKHIGKNERFFSGILLRILSIPVNSFVKNAV